MKVVVVANLKGGVAKTTTVKHLAYGLAEKGYTTCMIDSDSQCNLSLSTNTVPEPEYNLADVYKGTAKLKDCIATTDLGDCNIIAGSYELATLDINNILSNKGADCFQVLKKQIKQLNNVFDYVIIDTPPALNSLLLNALFVADEVIIPVETDYYSIQGLKNFVTLLHQLKEQLGLNINIAGILIQNYNTRTKISNEVSSVLDGLAIGLGTRVYSTKIRQTTEVVKASFNKTTVQEQNKKATASIDYDSWIAEYLKYSKKK